jgi:hypothetical protein
VTKRAHISDRTKLAATLLQMLRPNDAGQLVPVIPHDHAKLMTADQIISLFQFDHYPLRKEAGGPDEPWNLEPRPIREHRVKTATIDVPQVAKNRRVTKAQAEFQRRLLAKDAGEPREASRWPKRKLRSRPFRSASTG